MSRIKSPLGDFPNPFASHEGTFQSVEEAKYAIRAILRAYFGTDADEEEDYLFFKNCSVRFEKNPHFDLEFDHRRRAIIFIVKEPKGKDAEKQKAKIRKEISLHYAALGAESRSRTAMLIYRALEPEAKNAILLREREKEAKRRSN